MSMHRSGSIGIIGVCSVAWVGAAVACGSNFADDCRASRTCTAEAEGGAGGESETAGSASTHPGGGDDGSAVGGTGHDANSGDAGDAGSAPVAENPPPTVEAVTPEAGAENVEPGSSITLAFSEPLAATTISATSVKLLDGGVEVKCSITYDALRVTLVPELPLALQGTYTVSVSAAVTDVDGAALAKPFESSFSVRDGQFATIDAVTATGFQLADTIPMNAKGEAWLAWLDNANGAHCPAFTQSFLRGEAQQLPQALSTAGLTQCQSIAVGGNEAGVSVAAWQVSGPGRGNFTQQYRDGKWAVSDAKLAESTTMSRFRVAVAPNGVVTVFDSRYPGTSAYRTDEKGTWAPQADALSSNTAALVPEVAFDAAGNGLAVWRETTSADLEQIVTSRYELAAGKWAAATLLPGSRASAVGGIYERGAPALAMDPQGNAMAVWVNRKGQGAAEALTASRFSPATGWAAPVEVAAGLLARPTYDPPGLVFDGEGFVAAFTASSGTRLATYTTRFNPEAGTWSQPEARQAASDADTVTRMPRLVGDRRGNLMLIWATGAAPSFKLVYQRFAQGKWSQTTPLAAGSVTNQYFAISNYPLPIGINDSGLITLAWGNYDSDNLLTGVRLASFY